MKYILDYGIVYKMTNKQYRQYLIDIIQSEGKSAIFKGKLFCVPTNITDMTTEQAQIEFNNLKSDRP